MIQSIIDFAVNNTLVTGILGSAIGALVLFSIFRIGVNVALSPKNILNIANAIDDFVDKVQKKDIESGKLTRSKLIAVARNVITKLEESDGIN